MTFMVPPSEPSLRAWAEHWKKPALLLCQGTSVLLSQEPSGRFHCSRRVLAATCLTAAGKVVWRDRLGRKAERLQLPRDIIGRIQVSMLLPAAANTLEGGAFAVLRVALPANAAGLAGACRFHIFYLNARRCQLLFEALLEMVTPLSPVPAGAGDFPYRRPRRAAQARCGPRCGVLSRRPGPRSAAASPP